MSMEAISHQSKRWLDVSYCANISRGVTCDKAQWAIIRTNTYRELTAEHAPYWALCLLSPLILPVILWTNYYYPHLTLMETEPYRWCRNLPKVTQPLWERGNSNSGLCNTKSVLLTLSSLLTLTLPRLTAHHVQTRRESLRVCSLTTFLCLHPVMSPCLLPPWTVLLRAEAWPSPTNLSEIQILIGPLDNWIRNSSAGPDNQSFHKPSEYFDSIQFVTLCYSTSEYFNNDLKLKKE